MNNLKTSNIKIPFSTLKHVELRALTKKPSLDNNTKTFVNFVEARIMESIALNENGIRSFYELNPKFSKIMDTLRDGNEIKIKFNISSCVVINKVYENSRIKTLVCPLLLEYNEGGDKLKQLNIGRVMLTGLDESYSLSRFVNPIRPDQYDKNLSKLVISILDINNLFRQFDINELGQSGELYMKYNIRKTDNGHREYTFKG